MLVGSRLVERMVLTARNWFPLIVPSSPLFPSLQFVEQARIYIRPLQADIVDIFGQPCDAANVVSIVLKRVCGVLI